MWRKAIWFVYGIVLLHIALANALAIPPAHRIVNVTAYNGRDKDLEAVEAWQQWLESNGTATGV